jgi:hypothetical protein
MIVFDHEKLVKRKPTELARFRRWVLSGQAGELEQVIIEHENDHSCCRREVWNQTATAIITALKPSTPHVLINLNNPTGATP